MVSVPEPVAPQLIDAIAGQDEAALAACFAPAVDFRALIPPGLRERVGAVETSALISQWFSDTTEMELLDSHSDEVGDRLHVSLHYRRRQNHTSRPSLLRLPATPGSLFAMTRWGPVPRPVLRCPRTGTLTDLEQPEVR